MTTNMKDHFVGNIKEELGKVFRDTIEGQGEHDLYNKSFSNQLECDDEIGTLQQRIKWWMVVVDRGGLISNDFYDYTSDESFMLYRKTVDPEMQDLVTAIRDRQIIP